MSHEPGRERYMTHKCENCGHAREIAYSKSFDAYLCDECFTELCDEQEDEANAV